MLFNIDSPFIYGNKNSLDKESIYTSHPFTNWSLNPKFEFNNNLEHTEEGFRKVLNFNSLGDQLNQFSGSNKIYCMGGSSTYCAFLYGYEKTWPSKLQDKLDINKSIVINGGVGGWGTIQSLTRFIGWASIIQPKIVILYQSKNDLTPFYNGRSNQKKIFPLLENIILQFTKAKIDCKNNSRRQLLKDGRYINFIKTFLKKGYPDYVEDVSLVYSSEIHPHEIGFKRYDENALNSTIFRYETVFNIVNNWNGKVLFIPEIITQQSVYFKYMQHIHSNAKKLSEKYKNFYFFDLNNIITVNEKNFYNSKMHFTEEGCSIFSEMIFNTLNKIDNNI